MSNKLSSELEGAWEGKHHTNPILMDGAAMSFLLRLFLNCLSKARCSWQQSGGAIFGLLLHLSTEMGWHRFIFSFAWHPQTSCGLRGLPR